MLIDSSINELENYFLYKPSQTFNNLINATQKGLCLFTGNQFGKNRAVAQMMLMSIFGLLPDEAKNMRPDKVVRTYRCVSQKLPNDPDGGDIVNTQYPIIKSLLPKSLIKKDITMRNAVLIIADPQGGPDINIEFCGFKQEVQRMAGVQRFMVWIDESSPFGVYEENIPRLLAGDGWFIYTLTPAEHITWEFDWLFEPASIYYRTPAIIERTKLRFGVSKPPIETKQGKDIAVFMAATDDNPTFSKGQIDGIFDFIMDEDILDIRRFGIFKTVSGTIHKNFDLTTHVQQRTLFEPMHGLPMSWKHYRMIDFHELNSWAIVWASLSPDNELFVWQEMEPSPEHMTVEQIALQIATIKPDFAYSLNLIDPLAAKNQPSVGISALEHLNKLFRELAKQGKLRQSNWITWDTKSTRGRDEVSMRLANAKRVLKPFNNKVKEDGLTKVLPTLWILDNCKATILSLKNWKKKEWQHKENLITNEPKDLPQQKWSHFNMCLEALLKHPQFGRSSIKPWKPTHKIQYFKGKR